MKLRSEGVTKKFGNAIALDDIDWELEQGQTKAIIGPNGAGKSTFFNVLSGTYTPTSGEVYFDDEAITGDSVDRLARRGIVKTFQTTDLFWESSVYENLRIAAQAQTTIYDMYSNYEDLTEVNRRADELVDRLAMGDLREQTVEELSHGDQRKLEIGVALATEPDVLLLDEPTAGMEQGEIENALEFFDELSEDPSLSIAITEHDMDLILKVAEEITVLHQGRILAEGSPEDVIENEEVQRVYLEGS
jgi:branched-chain amino acid transport system ATP-binding protein